MWKKYPVFFFILSFLLIFMILYRVIYSPLLTAHFHPLLIRFNTYTSGRIISWFEEGMIIYKSSILSDKFSIRVIFDCCAIEPVLIYTSAVISYPLRVKSKIIGLILGIPTLLIINIIRIISLYFFGAYYGHLVMQRMHLDVWQVLIIIISLTLFLFWIYYVGKKTQNQVVNSE